MGKKKRLILLVGLIFLTVCTVGLAFPNEPDGFRDLKWGDAPTEDMYFVYEIISEYMDNAKIYAKYRENNNIGSAKLFSLEYCFNLRSNQFYKVSANFSKDKYFEILEVIFKDRFGEPTKREKDFLLWDGEKARVYLLGLEGNLAMLEFRSWEIKAEEPPEIDKTAEIEKAKTDF